MLRCFEVQAIGMKLICCKCFIAGVVVTAINWKLFWGGGLSWDFHSSEVHHWSITGYGKDHFWAGGRGGWKPAAWTMNFRGKGFSKPWSNWGKGGGVWWGGGWGWGVDHWSSLNKRVHRILHACQNLGQWRLGVGNSSQWGPILPCWKIMSCPIPEWRAWPVNEYGIGEESTDFMGKMCTNFDKIARKQCA